MDVNAERPGAVSARALAVEDESPRCRVSHRYNHHQVDPENGISNSLIFAFFALSLRPRAHMGHPI